MSRTASFRRKTKETEIAIKLNLDGRGRVKISTPIFFLNHLLDNFAKHGLFDLTIRAEGDIRTDQHHTVEDVGICLGESFKKALGSKKGINRAGYFVFPLDESLAVVAVDISGRAHLNFNCKFRGEKIGDLDSVLIKDFLEGFVRHLEATLHIRLLSGENDHHKAESIFKALGKAMKMACSKDRRSLGRLPTTKGLI